MDMRIDGAPVITLHGIAFRALFGEDPVSCQILPEALASLRQRCAPQLSTAPLRTFNGLAGEILALARRKFEQRRREPDGSICIRVEDVIGAAPGT